MKRPLILVFAVALTGCGDGNTEKNFLCVAQTGQPCRTLAEIDGASAVGGSTIAENGQD